MASTNTVEQVEEDFLEVDNPINGQRYVLLSFVSPNKLLKRKDLFSFHKFLKQREVDQNSPIPTENTEAETTTATENTETATATENTAATTTESTTTESTTENTATTTETTTETTTNLKPAIHTLTHEQFIKEYNDFMYSHRDNVDSEFNELVDFQTSVRGLKVRGVYETYREAKIRAARLQKTDRSFHVFIGQVGYWLPWDPEPDNIEDQEYLNRELNNLIHEYKKNQEYKDEVFDKHVQDSKDTAIREVAEHKAKQEALEAPPQDDDIPGNNSNTEVTSSETVSALEGDDPWIQRKKEQEKNATTVLEI